jgi:hypothetical protein
MKNKLANLFLMSQKINRQQIQLIFFILTLILLVLGAGAPDDGHPTGG